MRLLQVSPLLTFLLMTSASIALAQPSGLVVLSSKHPPTSVSVYDFGIVDPLQTKTLKCSFHLHNNTTNPITIEQIQPSCGCTSFLLSSSIESNGQTIIAPNETVTLDADIQVDHLKPGDFTKYIYVFTKGDLSPAVSLEMKGTVLPLIEFDPQVVDFGTVPFGQSHSQMLKVRIDARLLKNFHQPLRLDMTPLSAPQPSARQRSLPFIKTVLISKPHTVQWHSRTAIEVAYQVTLEPFAPLGPLQGTLYPTVPYPSNTIAHDMAYFKASVVGAFQCDPHVIVLGSVFQGRTAYDRAILKTTRPDLWHDLTIRTSAPYLKAFLLPAPTTVASSNSSLTRILQVQLTPSAPVGALTLHVFVQAIDREQMDIPVYVNVMPKNRN